AFAKMVVDPEFLADAAKQRRDVEFVSGDEIQEIVESMAATPKDKLAKLDELMKFQGQTATAKIEMLRHTGKVVESKNGGREIVIDHEGKKVSAKVSGSRTKLTLDGKAAKREAFKPGMTCPFVYDGPG